MANKYKYVFVVIEVGYETSDIHSIWQDQKSAEIVVQYEAMLNKDTPLNIEKWKLDVPKKGLAGEIGSMNVDSALDRQK